MSVIAELLKLLIPAGLVLYGMYLTVRVMIDREFRQKQEEVRSRNSEAVTPIRLQAYERMALFLERISPNNLLLRLANGAPTALDLQQLLLRDIREEFNHNLSQQIYMSQPTWDLITSAMNEVMALINQAAAEVPPEAPAIDLSKRIFDKVIQQNAQPVGPALRAVKEEVQQTFM